MRAALRFCDDIRSGCARVAGRARHVRVVERLEGEPALVIADRLATRYTGRPFPMRSGVAFLVEPERVFSMNLPFDHTPA